MKKYLQKEIMDKEHLRRSIFKVLKTNKSIFNTFEWIMGYKDIRVQRELHPEGPCKSKKQISEEKKQVRQYWRCGTFHYHRYGLAYMNLSKDELLDYVPTYYHHKVLEKAHAGVDTVIYGDKLTQAKLFAERSIPSASVLAVYKNGNWYDFREENKIGISLLVISCMENEGNKLFIKPTGGQGGDGIWVLKRKNGQYLLNGEQLDGVDLLNAKLTADCYILQEGIMQSQQMMEINSSSVNTLRVVVQKDGDNKMLMRSCIIRMGRQGKEVDNSAQGGISVKVDVNTGQVAPTATAEHGGGVLMCHPDSGKSFGDIVINDWCGLKHQIEEIGTKLIDFKNIALDIAVTDEGAKLLEFNFRYGIEHQQCVLGGVRRLLGIFPNKE